MLYFVIVLYIPYFLLGNLALYKTLGAHIVCVCVRAGGGDWGGEVFVDNVMTWWQHDQYITLSILYKH